MSLHIWLAFVATSVVVVLTPGPTVLMVIGDALANGRRSLSTVLGVGLGDTVAMTLSLAGAGALLRASATAFSVMKTIGGCYLLYLGIRSVWKARKETGYELEAPRSAPSSNLARFSKGFVITVLNPKAILFYVAFVPQFISAGSSFLTQSAILMVTFVPLAMLNAAMYMFLASSLAQRLTSRRTQQAVGYAGGGVLIAAGGLTFALKHR